MEFLSNLIIDRTSFWIGFVAGMLFFFILSSLRRFIPFVIKAIRKQIQIARERAAADVVSRLRHDVFVYAQHQHLAAVLFPLDNVLIEPRLLAPPILTNMLEGEEVNKTDVASLTIPYMPDFPEIGSLYGAPTLTLSDALQDGANLILMGHPGSGRTVALAHLASLLAKRDSSVGKLIDYIPLLLHASWLQNQLSASKPPSITEVLTGAASNYTSPITSAQLPGILRNTLENGRIILLIDGFDEVPPEAQQSVKGFLESLLKNYRKARVIVATSTDYFAGMNHLGLYPVAMASWNEYDRQEFIKLWEKNWNLNTPPGDTTQLGALDPLLITSWLASRENGLTPLEFTLKVWGAFAGDALGPDILSILESHIRRLSVNVSGAQTILERLAVQMVVNMKINPSARQAERWVSHFEEAHLADTEKEEEELSGIKKPVEKQSPSSDAIYNLTSNGLLVSQAGTIHFSHPVFLYYLAGQGLADSNYSSSFLELPDWDIKSQTSAYWGCYADISPQVDAALSSAQEPVHAKTFHMGRWLRIFPRTSAWRVKLMQQLVDLVNKESFTTGIAGRALAALAISGDSGMAALFRQLIKSNLAHLRYLGALGSGFLLDNKAINSLSSILDDEDPRVSGAACLALVAVGSKAALDIVMALLLQGSETARRFAAESLANNVPEGHPALEEASTLPDLLVRRSAVFGLMRIKQPWTVKILEKMEIEDGQWVVRTAANQALEEYRQPDPHIPRPLPPLSDTPWLINFAGKLGMGVTSGKQALDLVNKALETGEPRERLSALEYFQQNGSDEVILQLYQTYFGSQATLREAAYNTLWHYQASGMKLPSSIQYGLH